ncbi:MAG: efflux RND transporter permease subunit VexD [Alphaproteobacteria bacterium]
MSLADFAIHKRVISALATVLILWGGYVAYTLLPRFEDPEFIIRQAQIITTYDGATPAQVADEVTDVIEGSLQQLQGVKEVTSVSSQGLSEVTVEFTIPAAKTRTALNEKFTQMRAKIRDAQRQLPPGSGPSQVYDDFGDVYALYYALTGEDFSLRELEEYAEQLQKDLVLVDGVARVALVGAPQQVIHVEYDPARLLQLNLTSSQIAQQLEAQSGVVAAGSTVSGQRRLTIQTEQTGSSVEQLANLVIADSASGITIRLKDIATVRQGVREPISKLLFRNGKPAIGIGVSNTIGGNVVEMGDAVNARLAELAHLRPLGMDIEPISDQSVSVRQSVNDFVMNVVVALAIVVGTLLVFMGLRSGLLMGGILLITVSGTLIGMYLYGLDLQRISLGALIIALGMLVDNAIVVVEGTLVRVQKGEDTAAAAIDVVSKTKWPLLGGTVVGFLAFSPIGFSPDNTGEYASSLFWTIAISLVFSWLVAIWLTPWLCTLFLKPGEKKQAEEKEAGVLTRYRGVLRLALQYRGATVVIALALMGSAIATASMVNSGFFPSSTRAQFVVDYTLPAGTDITQTQADLQDLADHIRGLDGVVGTNTVIGGGHLRFMLVYSAESGNAAYGQILVDVDDYRVIEGMLGPIQEHIKSTYPDALAKVWKFVLGPGGGSKIEIEFSGPDAVVLRDLAEQAKAIYAEEGAIAIQDDWSEQVPSIKPRIDAETAARFGLSQADVAQAIAGHFNGSTIGAQRDGDELYPIIMRPVLEQRDNPEQLRQINVFSAALGQYVPISQIVSGFDTGFDNAKLRRVDRALTIKAQSDPLPSVNSGELFDRIRPRVEAINLPAGYSHNWGGEYGDSQGANAGLASTMPLGFGAMVVVVILLFNALRQPMIIFLTVPLAAIGVIFGLAFTGTPLEFMAILGALSLIGMMIKNAIVLIDQMDLEISEGKAPIDAVVDSAVSRVRPVALGVITTVLGVVPLLWDPFFKSLAVVIITGLSFATFLTLLIVPTLYALFFGISVPRPVKRPAQKPAK